MRMIDEIAIDGLGGLAGALAMFTVFTLGKKVGFVRTPMPEVMELPWVSFQTSCASAHCNGWLIILFP